VIVEAVCAGPIWYVSKNKSYKDANKKVAYGEQLLQNWKYW